MKTRQTIISPAAVVMAAFACLLMMTAVATATMYPNYAVREISIVPNPPEVGEPTEICCEVTNPTSSSVDIQLQFAWDELGIGLSFNLINGLHPVFLPPFSVVNECIYWIPPLSGPFSIQVEIIRTGYETLWVQNNLDIDASLLPGVPNSRTFKVGNPTGSTANVTLTLVPHVSGWEMELTPEVFNNMAAGSEQTATLTVTPPPSIPLPQDGTVIVDVEGFIAGELIGGLRKIYGSDSDGDGVKDAVDNCPRKPNGPEGGICTSGTIGDPCMSHGDCGCEGECSTDQEDVDSDGYGDVCDNCPYNCNYDQWDADGDGIGDVCDPTPGCGHCAEPECEQECFP
jgi:hypothetical protein